MFLVVARELALWVGCCLVLRSGARFFDQGRIHELVEGEVLVLLAWHSQRINGFAEDDHLVTRRAQARFTSSRLFEMR